MFGASTKSQRSHEDHLIAPLSTRIVQPIPPSVRTGAPSLSSEVATRARNSRQWSVITSAGYAAAAQWLLDTPARVIVIERADRLVPLAEPRFSALIRRRLEAAEIEVVTGTSVERITDDAVYAGDISIPARTVFWATGISSPIRADVLARSLNTGQNLALNGGRALN